MNINIPGIGNLDALKKKSIVFSDTSNKYRKYMYGWLNYKIIIFVNNCMI